MYNKMVINALILSAALITGIAWPQSDRDKWQQPEKIMDKVGLRPGMVIGEVGAGTGYFTFKMAARVGPQGKIYANDIDRSALKELEEQAERDGVRNIEIIVGGEKDPRLPDDLEMVFMVYVLHDVRKQALLLENIKPSLAPGATLVIVEGDTEYYDDSHFLNPDEVEQLLKAAGYELVTLETFLPRDNLFVYRLPEAQ
jgi:ubiquinone/menaquinone biosynthesis C-methylase UbiE